MSRVGCYICNYNGKDYAGKCIQSVLEQVKIDENFRLYMVDNASTDGTGEYIRERFKEQVCIIQNPINRGGAGGFNTALKDAIDRNYDYVILLDNDIIVEEGCISAFIQYMDSHPDTGCVGAKIMIMDRPDYIQEFGGQLDFERYDLIKNYWYELDRGCQDVIESDWVSSCALIARMDAVRKTDLFPEENFLYWDDIEFTYQIKLAGYRVASLASAKVYHKGKKKPVTTTANGYYGMRNRIKFFSRYEAEERLPHLCEIMLDEYFQIFFGSASKGFHAANSSRMSALDDFVHKHYGKADADKIYAMDEKEDQVRRIAAGHEVVFVELPVEEEPRLMEAVGALCRRLHEIGDVARIAAVVSPSMLEEMQKRLRRYCDQEIEFTDRVSEGVLVFRPCGHFREVEEDICPVVWFDKYLNCVGNHEDFARVRAYPYIKEFFVRIHYEWLMKGILAERGRVRRGGDGKRGMF